MDCNASETILYPAVTHDGVQIHWTTDERGEKALCGAVAPYAPIRRTARATCKSCIRREVSLVARCARLASEAGYA